MGLGFRAEGFRVWACGLESGLGLQKKELNDNHWLSQGRSTTNAFVEK